MEKINSKLIKELVISEEVYYVDYNDNLESHLKELQETIQKNELEHIEEVLYNAYLEQEFEYENRAFNELTKSLIDKGYSHIDVNEFLLKNEESIKEIIFEEAKPQNLFKEVLSNTGRIIARYETSFEMESDSWSWDFDQVQEEANRMKEFLQIKDDKYDALIKDVIENSDGGTLMVYFEIDGYIDMLTENKSEEYKKIKFRNPSLGIVDEYNGSGYTDYFQFHEFEIDFDRTKICLEKNIQYNWTYAIAGMVHNWCEQTGIELIKEEDEKSI